MKALVIILTLNIIYSNAQYTNQEGKQNSIFNCANLIRIFFKYEGWHLDFSEMFRKDHRV